MKQMNSPKNFCSPVNKRLSGSMSENKNINYESGTNSRVLINGQISYKNSEIYKIGQGKMSIGNERNGYSVLPDIHKMQGSIDIKR